MATNRQKYIKKYGEDAVGGVGKVAKVTGIPKSILQETYNRGIGAYKSNPASVRTKSGRKDPSAPLSQKMSKEQWAMARVYAYVMRSRSLVGKSGADRDLYEKELKMRRKKT